MGAAHETGADAPWRRSLAVSLPALRWLARVSLQHDAHGVCLTALLGAALQKPIRRAARGRQPRAARRGVRRAGASRGRGQARAAPSSGPAGGPGSLSALASAAGDLACATQAFGARKTPMSVG